MLSGARLLPLLVLVLVASPAYAALPEGTMKIYAVTSEGTGLDAELKVELGPGDGTVWSAVQPLVGTTTQSAERTAVEVAKNYSTEANNYDYKFTIISDASVVEGPSAGAAMALLTISLLKGKSVPENVSITGTINRDGFVGGVGGVFAKSQVAAETGIDLFMIPKGEAQQTVTLDGTVQSVNLIEYAPREFGVKVVEVSTIDDVLRYAFSDIGEIDVNAEAAVLVPQFIPKPITYPSELEPMKLLTNHYIEETTVLIGEAKNAVATTLIEDHALISTLFELVTNAEQTLGDAKLLNDQNYLYSAANYAFLARVNASLVKDLSTNPSLLAPGSTALELKLKTLRDEAKTLRIKLDEWVSVDYLEYHIAAKQRLSYAQEKIEELLATQVVVVGASPGEEAGIAIEQIQDYEFALAWYKVASDMYDITLASELRAKPGDAFKESVGQYIVEAENGLAVIGGETDTEDIERRLSSAKRARGRGWHVSAIFDSVSALSLANGEIAVRDRDLNQLYSMLREKISEVGQGIADSGHEFIWAKLYLDHATYYLESADFYYGQDQGAATVDSLKSGIALAYLAENLFIVSEDIYSYYDSLGPEGFLPTEAQPPGVVVREPPITGAQYLFAFVIVFSLGAVVVIVIVGRALVAEGGYARHYSVQQEIRRLKKLQKKIDESFSKGKVKREKYAALSRRHAEELEELEAMRRAKSRQIVELDGMQAELSALKKRLKDLEQHRTEGVILKRDYEELSSAYKRGIERLGNRIKERQLAMRVSKEKLMKISKEIWRE